MERVGVEGGRVVHQHTFYIDIHNNKNHSLSLETIIYSRDGDARNYSRERMVVSRESEWFRVRGNGFEGDRMVSRERVWFRGRANGFEGEGIVSAMAMQSGSPSP
jgi:hypothetical protein